MQYICIFITVAIHTLMYIVVQQVSAGHTSPRAVAYLQAQQQL